MSSPMHASHTESESGHQAQASSPAPSRTSSLPSHDPVEEEEEELNIFGGRPSLHGPALPSDHPDQIYDDFSGELVQNRPSPEPFGNFGDNNYPDYFRDRESPSDSEGFVPSEHPESDGFLGQYDVSQFAEEQRLFAPDNLLVASAEDDWWCWPSKQECLLDLMSGFPRACFSEKELNMTRWYAKMNGVSRQPTKQRELRRHYLTGTLAAPQAILLGNCFAVNDWFKILKHEFANPLIRPKLHLYPEDSGEKLEEARQAAKWKEEVDGNISGPMARGIGGVRPVMPMRWFTRNGKLLSIVHLLHLTPSKSAFVIDGTDRGCIEIPLEDYFLNVCDLEDPECQARYGIPPPFAGSVLEAVDIICLGISRDPALPLEVWTQPSVNEWHIKAKGRHVHSVPLWTYCDDTSGNVSKKWNKYNSILFTLAGLPCALTQMLYNIHFIATSNLSPPLEMIEAVVAMLREARKDGIEVWDCEYNEWILIIPWFLAFQGDNPMLSEFASHVGMKGKPEPPERKSKQLRTPPPSFSVLLTVPQVPSMTWLLTAVQKINISNIFSINFRPWHRNLGTSKRSGVQAFEAGLSKAEEVKKLLHQLRTEMPANIFNPLLSILDFDTNADTPVEILHVVLLGVVKYWWRDAVSRQTSKGKEELKACPSSVDVAGLNTPPIRSYTYVQYAGSLVGRDFRVILQVVLVVLHGLIPQAHYNGWVALCKLALFMFQPAIEDMPSHLQLKNAFSDFLNATALWNTQWFNKPKFHLFVHLVEHIWWFGPLILYATESFESFNLVIRLRSIHSTKHAPSVDIARAFSHLHAIRHLVSGGYVLADEDGNSIPPRQAGPEVLALLNDNKFLGFMSMSGLKDVSKSGVYMPLVGMALCGWKNTEAGKLGTFTLLRHGNKDGASCIGSPAAQELLCAVNVNHNCAAHQCKTTLTRRVTQERQKTDHFENEVNHAVEPNDCFLNLAQLRSATDLQKFRSSICFPDVSLAEAIKQSIHNQEQLEREAKEAEQQEKAVEKAAKAAERAAKADGRAAKAAGRGNGKKRSQVDPPGQGAGPKKKRKEVDPDFADDGEELYRVSDATGSTVTRQLPSSHPLLTATSSALESTPPPAGSRLRCPQALCQDHSRIRLPISTRDDQKLLKSLLQHYIIRPLTSYNNLVSLSETYIHDHAKRLHLELYKTDPTIKTVIWASLKEKMTLMDFSKKIISTHHLPTILTTPPKDIMACLALMRKVVHPLLGKETTRGGDTGFWTNMEKELDHLFKKNGNSRTNADWIKWEQEIIDQDNCKYNRYAAESHARTCEEIDAAGLPGGGEALTGPAADDGARPAANDEARSVANCGDDEDQDTRDGRDVNVSALGDLASLSSDVVAC
ncbi:hypothetical protein FB451DRAFT_1379084 [Mycena latifolia]|nr:hypothetical protein FB451DRAFT_1379084 [Mycena latifolia]